MDVQFTEKKLIEVFCEVDDLLQSYKKFRIQIGDPIKELRTSLNCSEVVTILIMYHFSGYKCFEYYYKEKVLKDCISYFPDAVSYEGFLGYMKLCQEAIVLCLWYKIAQSKRTGYYIIDSKKLEVCHLKRERSNKVFAGKARKGKGSMGWFYGFKIHLVINNLGEIVDYEFTTGNVADNNQNLLKNLLKGLQGILIGDKGYKTKLFQFFYEKGLHVLTKPKKNMKPLPVQNHYNILLNKRAVIESVFDILSSICDIEHSRHRNSNNAFVHMHAALVAYQFLDKKPRIFVPKDNLLNAA